MTEEVTAKQELEEVAVLYGNWVAIKNNAENKVDEFKSAFLDLVTEVVQEEMTLPILTLPTPDEAIDKWLRREYPGYKLISEDEESKTIFIQEDPKFIKYDFTAGGFSFGRTVAKTGASFNPDGLRQAVEEIRKVEGDEAADAVLGCFTERQVVVYDYDDKQAAKIKLEHPGLVHWFEKFTDPGTLQVRMKPVKPVKEEDV